MKQSGLIENSRLLAWSQSLALLMVVCGLFSSVPTFGQSVAKPNQEQSKQDQSQSTNPESKTDDAPEVTVESSVTPEGPSGIRFGDKPAKYKWKVGFKVVTGRNACRNFLATIPVPKDWPEQTVEIVEESVPSTVQDYKYRELDGGVKQLVCSIRTLPPKTIVEVDLVFSVSVKEILAPVSTGGFSIPKKATKELKPYLGVSPGISYRNSKLRREVKKIVAEKPNAWTEVEAIYDWIRDNVEFRDGEPKDNISAYRSKAGCAEDLVGLFVAMCRCHKVPARMVWVEGHQIAEFYLVDGDAKGHWFPCNVAGLRDFGSNSDPRIVLQKGDSIKVPEKEQRQKYVAEFVTGSGKSKPAVGFIRELLPN